MSNINQLEIYNIKYFSLKKYLIFYFKLFITYIPRAHRTSIHTSYILIQKKRIPTEKQWRRKETSLKIIINVALTWCHCLFVDTVIVNQCGCSN
jgi:hypothetical protein